MSDVFNNLRQKLDLLGYTQSLPLSAIPLVLHLFEDLVKTTESLRDAKKQIAELLEEKTCWELGIEPYKCDNSRLLAECNQLHIQLINQREDFEQQISELTQTIRNLQTDKLYLEQHCEQLQQQLKTLLGKQTKSSSMKNTEDKTKVKKPFITVVRPGERIPPPGMPLSQSNMNLRCNKCNAGCYQSDQLRGHEKTNATQIEMEKLENKEKDLTEQITFYKRKVEARDREITRLNDLLAGGRSPATLAKDCCYKDLKALNEDIELLQREKTECLNKIRDYQDQMHEAMERAMDLESRNTKLQKDLDELKKAALHIESEANAEIEKRDNETEVLLAQLKNLQKQNIKKEPLAKVVASKNMPEAASLGADKRLINERINALTQKKSELKLQNESLHKKLHKLKAKLSALQQAESQDKAQSKEEHFVAEKIRLKSERDFFQKEYLQLLSKTGSENEIQFLHSQIKVKDDELRALRSELWQRQQNVPHLSTCNFEQQVIGCPSQQPPLLSSSARTDHSSPRISSDCIQAAIIRAERERDCARAELEQIRSELDILHEKHTCLTKIKIAEAREAEQRIGELELQIKKSEREKRDMNERSLPSETQIVLLKEQMEILKRQLLASQEESYSLKTNYSKLKILQEQTERSLVEYQNKLIIAEHHLDAANIRVNTLDSNREMTHNESTQLRNEVAALKHTYVALENEKDKLLAQLDTKTEQTYQLEYELSACKEKRHNLEIQLRDLQQQFEKLNVKTRHHDTELHESSAESKSLRQQIVALKKSREEAIAENGRLSNELAERESEILILRKKLKDSETEIDRLKQQLRQYVQEVKKAEDLLLQKETERGEMLEHYRSLSHDAVLLEGNNQSLENEAAEYKRQICEYETDIEALKKEICSRNNIIEQLEDKLSALAARNTCLERQLEEAIDDQHLLKVDLAARKELCEKLDIQKEKLNAELTELNEIRRKLEVENDKTRRDLEKTTNSGKVSTDTLEEILAKTRSDLEEQIKVDSKLSQELIRLRAQNDDLLKELDVERERRQQHEILAREYQVQNQELRHNLTDDRFRQARSREQSPRFPTQTM